MRIHAKSAAAADALTLVSDLQQRFVERLGGGFQPVEWLRDEGRHGGGVRFEAPGGSIFDRGSVNVSQVHYDDLPDKRLSSATAISTIIHPANPRAPSVHIHVSWTEMRDGHAYWRIMADLNPAIPIAEDEQRFTAALREAAGEHYEAGAAQGDRYFSIPALERRRGVTHYYLESFHTADPVADRALAERVGRAAIDTYTDLLPAAVKRTYDDADRAAQLAYHTVYLFQVLTLDRGTTSGLLIHDQNDVGILGSLPSHVDGPLLRSWKSKVVPPQDALVDALAAVIGDAPRAEITTDRKKALAQAVREHYRAHPEALALQASGDVIPPTVQNHS